MLDQILEDFRRTFPDLNFDLRPEFRIINAQAITLAQERCVILYGGLAYHPWLDENSLTFVLLHETGHHLAEGRKLPFYSNLACECSADHWAGTKGAELLLKKSGRRLTLRLAVEELGRILEVQEQLAEPHYKKYKKLPLSSCWNCDWFRRKNAILQQKAQPEDTNCDI